MYANEGPTTFLTSKYAKSDQSKVRYL